MALPAAVVAEDMPSLYVRTDLVSDQPGVAAITDPSLVNAWGMSFGPTTPVWVSDNGADVATLYRGANGTTP
ncbi:MAG TPA: TIGR03118 family protein, partial [Candidatus Dormibacteraeota bacterium]|nr:TIGR03118 family protein [Candidatus Dormibacteraeota bacterium]